MFEQMKAFGALAGLMKDKDRLREAGDEFKRRIEAIRAAGQAGGGAVRVEVNGKMRTLGVTIDPAVIAGAASGDDGRAQVERLIAEAFDDAVEQAQAMLQHEAQRMARELDLPEIPGVERLLGGG